MYNCDWTGMIRATWPTLLSHIPERRVPAGKAHELLAHVGLESGL